MRFTGSHSRALLFTACLCATGIGMSQEGGVLLNLQPASPAAQATSSTTRDLSGEVIDSVTGQPIARALVQCGNHAVLTDHEGRFALAGLADDSPVVVASKPGYFPRDPGSIDSNGHAVVTLIPEGTVSGIVTDQNGDSVQNVAVELRMMQPHNGLMRLQSVQTVSTNAEGEYRFSEVQEGKYSIATALRFDGFPDTASGIAYAPVVYPPPTPDPSSSEFSVSPGQHLEANLSLPAEKLFAVTGTMHGRPGPDVALQAETADGEPVSTRMHFEPNTGNFRAMLPSGSYRLVARSFSEREQLVGIAQVSIDHAAINGVAISLQPQIDLPAEIDYDAINQIQGTAPDAKPWVNLCFQDFDSKSRFSSFCAQPANFTGRPMIRESGGPMMFKATEPGRYEMQAQVAPPWYLASATCGNVDLTREPLELALGNGACTIHTVVRNDSATLNWSIAPADPAALARQAKRQDVFAIAIPLENVTSSWTVMASSGLPAQGKFEGLAPGHYLVMALDHQRDLPYREPDALRRYMSLGQEVTLARNGKADVELKLVIGEP